MMCQTTTKKMSPPSSSSYDHRGWYSIRWAFGVHNSSGTPLSSESPFLLLFVRRLHQLVLVSPRRCTTIILVLLLMATLPTFGSAFTTTAAATTTTTTTCATSASASIIVRQARRTPRLALFLSQTTTTTNDEEYQQQKQQDQDQSIRSNTNDGMMKQDIQEMRLEAASRLEALASKVQQQQQQQHDEATINQSALLSSSSSSSKVLLPSPLSFISTKEKIGVTATVQGTIDAMPTTTTTTSVMANKDVTTMRMSHANTASSNDTNSNNNGKERFSLLKKRSDHANDLLDGTRWKIGYNIGREPGTWMPATWGQSAEQHRLWFQVTVDFTNESAYDCRDDFFQGVVGMKRLRVVESFITPRTTGGRHIYDGSSNNNNNNNNRNVGRRSLPVESTGAYKVCTGAGPMGTDVVRFYIELTEQVEGGVVAADGNIDSTSNVSDVYCPKGRIYGTCGYFPLNSRSQNRGPSYKELAVNQHADALRRCRDIQTEIDAIDPFNFDRIKLLRDLWKAKDYVKEATKQLEAARLREPEKSQLRLSLHQDVGLTRQGGVCCKVNKGLLVQEYHILGRLELACVEDRND